MALNGLLPNSRTVSPVSVTQLRPSEKRQISRVATQPHQSIEQPAGDEPEPRSAPTCVPSISIQRRSARSPRPGLRLNVNSEYKPSDDAYFLRFIRTVTRSRNTPLSTAPSRWNTNPALFHLNVSRPSSNVTSRSFPRVGQFVPVHPLRQFPP